MLIINPTNEITKINEKSKTKYDPKIILSTFKGDEKRWKTDFCYVPWGYREASTLYNAFWLIKIQKINYSKILITNIQVDHKLLELKNEPDDWEVEVIFKDKSPKKIEILINNKKVIETPPISYYDNNVKLVYDDYILGWLYELKKNFKCNYEISKEDAYSFFSKSDRLKKRLKNKRKLLYSKEAVEKKVVNAGNEGVLYLEKLNRIKKVAKIRKNKVETIINCSIPALEELAKFNKTLKMEVIKNGEDYEYIYENIILPTNNLNYADSAIELIQQINLSIFIDDNKLENMGRIHKIGPIYKIMHIDYGSSYLKAQQGKGVEFKKLIHGFIRDTFILCSEYKNRNCREIIKDYRVFEAKELMEINDKFEKFYSFIFNNLKRINDDIYLCHDENLEKKILKIRPKYVYLCLKDVSTMKHKRATEKKVNYVFDLFNDVANICLFKDKNEKIHIYKDFELVKTKKYKTELGIELFEVKDSIKFEVNYK